MLFHDLIEIEIGEKCFEMRWANQGQYRILEVNTAAQISPPIRPSKFDFIQHLLVHYLHSPFLFSGCHWGLAHTAS